METQTTFPHAVCSTCVPGGEAHGRSARPSCDAEFARSLKVFYHSMTSVRAELQRLRRHRPGVSAHLRLRPPPAALEGTTRAGLITKNKPGCNCNKKRLSQIKMKLEDFHFFSSLDAVSFPWNVRNVNQNFNDRKSWRLAGYLTVTKARTVFQQFCCSIKKFPIKESSSTPPAISSPQPDLSCCSCVMFVCAGGF